MRKWLVLPIICLLALAVTESRASSIPKTISRVDLEKHKIVCGWPPTDDSEDTSTLACMLISADGILGEPTILGAPRVDEYSAEVVEAGLCTGAIGALSAIAHPMV